MIETLKLVFHHVGVAVDNIDESLIHYRAIFGSDSVSEKITISTQNVNVCFVRVGVDAYIELVEANSDDSSILRLRKKGISYYHTAYFTENIEQTVNTLVAMNYKPNEYFKSEAFEGMRCIFLFSPEAQLIELIEK